MSEVGEGLPNDVRGGAGRFVKRPYGLLGSALLLVGDGVLDVP